MRNHTGTHILHAALRETLGSHVRQTGSLVAPDRLRFDFSHPSPLSPDEIRRIEELCNRTIEADFAVSVEVKPLEEARHSGALMFFDEKYGSEVRVVSVGNFSRELCGGTHCARSGQIGMLKIVSETGIGSGIRRIEAVTGLGVLKYVGELEARIEAVCGALGARPGEEAERASFLAVQVGALTRELKDLRQSRRSAVMKDALVRAMRIGDIPLLVTVVEARSAEELRSWADAWKGEGAQGVCILGGRSDTWAGILVAVSEGMRGRADAGALVRTGLSAVGGKGGGRWDLAQGGLANPSQLEKAVASLKEAAEAMLSSRDKLDLLGSSEGKRAGRAE